PEGAEREPHATRWSRTFPARCAGSSAAWWTWRVPPACHVGRFLARAPDDSSPLARSHVRCLPCDAAHLLAATDSPRDRRQARHHGTTQCGRASPHPLIPTAP